MKKKESITFSKMFGIKANRGFYIEKLIHRAKDQQSFISIWNKCKKKYIEDDAFDRRVKRLLKKVIKDGDGFLREKIEIRYIDPIMGHGAFAKKNIAKGDILGEYVGMVKRLSPKEDKRLQDTNGYLFEFTDIDELDDFVIDAKTYGNFIRFVNHAKKGSKKENLIATICSDLTSPHVIYYAKRNIRKGEQLCLDYGEESYWKQTKYKPS